MRIDQQGTRYTLWKEKQCIGWAELAQGHLAHLEIDPAWRRRGYGSYLLKELLRRGGGFDRGAESCFTAPPPADEAGRALAARFGFVPAEGHWCRRRVPDLSAVTLCHGFLRAHCPAGGFYIDATCGNGHDTVFLCELAGKNGRVLALDIQPAAVDATNRRLAEKGLDGIGRAVQADHAGLARLAAPGSADCVLFNFGWLPGADHDIHSTAHSSLAALTAALGLLRPGGVLAAVLYSGKVIGSSEKQAALEFFRGLPLTEYTVLECRFANWADTAPLPCFAIKKAAAGR
ncbi:MAG: GNAT family N-acetyltransferase [Gemmiger sp.]